MLGWPQVILHGASSAKVASFVAKLANVAPDGYSALITDGALNGTRRSSLTNPEPMQPGEIYELKIPMAPTGWVIPAGHRLRLAISSADFPNLWPTPYRASEPGLQRRRSSVPDRATRGGQIHGRAAGIPSSAQPPPPGDLEWRAASSPAGSL